MQFFLQSPTRKWIGSGQSEVRRLIFRTDIRAPTFNPIPSFGFPRSHVANNAQLRAETAKSSLWNCSWTHRLRMVQRLLCTVRIYRILFLTATWKIVSMKRILTIEWIHVLMILIHERDILQLLLLLGFYYY